MTRWRVAAEKQFGEGENLAKNPNFPPPRAPILDETSSLKASEARKKDINDVDNVRDLSRTRGAMGQSAELFHWSICCHDWTEIAAYGTLNATTTTVTVKRP